jgi:Tfp pilus assembly protein PilO
MNQSTKTALAIVAVIALAGAFWLLLLGPKREEANKLAELTSSLRSEVSQEQQRAEVAVAAKREFPRLYGELVLLGKAVPGEAATPSLLVQLSSISRGAGTRFQSIALKSGEEAAAPVAAATGSELPPIGAGPGPAGLSALPYDLQFNGQFFDIADFIEGLNSLVETKDGVVVSKGRLITIDGFNMAPNGEEGSAPGELATTFDVSTYVIPPGQGLTAGATAAGPSTTTSGQP